MIKNVIFDVGNVLVAFDWQGLFEELGLRGEVYQRVADATVRSELWNEYDRSNRSDEELLAGFISLSPEDEPEIRSVWDNIGDAVTCYSYTKAWIKKLKEQGFKVYLLSNYPQRTYELTKDELSFEHEMDGGIFSYQTDYIKPEKEIYQALVDKYHLIPQECVFLDDNINNVRAAVEFGMKGIVFTTQEAAVKELAGLV